MTSEEQKPTDETKAAGPEEDDDAVTLNPLEQAQKDAAKERADNAGYQ